MAKSLGRGKKALSANERTFPKGSLMFIEGESSSEMFIIRSGKVRILKQEGEKTIELAVLGKGSVLGEMSLLDKQPRSATGQVVEELTASIIDNNQFQNTLKKIPDWLNNIIQVVLGRLRETMKKTSDTIVQKSVAGVIRVLILLYKHEAVDVDGEMRIPVVRANEVISSTIGIGENEINNALLHLNLKELLFIRKDNYGVEYILLRNLDVMDLYMNYLRSEQRGVKLPGSDIGEHATDLLNVIIEAGDKNGRIVKPGIKKIGAQQVEIELQRRDMGKNIDLDSLDELIDSKVIFEERDTVSTSHQAHKRTVFIYSESAVKKVALLSVWLPLFREDVKF
jgi:CRP-like cAMP-binding protein